MKAINGNLDMSKHYKLIDIEYGTVEDGAGEHCQNCGNFITNVAIVEREDGERFRIGLDCMNTIINMSPSEKQEAKNRLNRLKRFYKHLKEEVKTIVYNPKYGLAWTYKRPVEKWEIGWKYRIVWNEFHKNLIEKLNIPIIIDDK